MKLLTQIVKESTSNGEWCLWDYTENGVREILVWKGDGKDQSDVTEIDKDGYELMNVDFKEIEIYCILYAYKLAKIIVCGIIYNV